MEYCRCLKTFLFFVMLPVLQYSNTPANLSRVLEYKVYYQ